MSDFKIWMNGRLVPQDQATLPVNSAAVFYATNVFEGLRAYWNERDGELYGFRLADHFSRLRESMKMMRFTVPYSDDDLFEAVREVMRATTCVRTSTCTWSPTCWGPASTPPPPPASTSTRDGAGG